MMMRKLGSEDLQDIVDLACSVNTHFHAQNLNTVLVIVTKSVGFVCNEFVLELTVIDFLF